MKSVRMRWMVMQDKKETQSCVICSASKNSIGRPGLPCVLPASQRPGVESPVTG